MFARFVGNRVNGNWEIPLSRQTPNRPFPKERRAFGRSSVLWNGLLHHDGQCAGCIVLDISANGVKLRFQEPKPLDQNSCALELPRLGIFSCDIAWRDGMSVGLRFNDDLSVVVSQLSQILPQSRTAR